jgi:riboflavin synthase
MFSGIVQEKGLVLLAVKSEILKLSITVQTCIGCSIGDSIAVNGVCLTIIKIDSSKSALYFDVVFETLKKTNLELLEVNDEVNIEKSIRVGDYVGGHIVQGHIDGVGEVTNVKNESAGVILLNIKIPFDMIKFLVAKGFVAIDGMSITIIDVNDTNISVTLIPHTLEATIANSYLAGSVVNIEVDPIGKHIHNYMEKMQ